MSIINDLKFSYVDKKRFPIVKLLDTISELDSLFETVIVSANDSLVQLFLNKKIKFTDITRILLKIVKNKEFTKLKLIKPKNIDQILQLNDYVSLKIKSLRV